MNDFISYTINLMEVEVLINGFYLELWSLKRFLSPSMYLLIIVSFNTNIWIIVIKHTFINQSTSRSIYSLLFTMYPEKP